MKNFTVILFIFNGLFCFSQTKTIHIAKEKETEIYTIVDEQAEFPGGISEMMMFVRKNLVFPKSALEDTTFMNCRTYIKFVVNEQGEVGNESVLKGCNGCIACDEESIRVIKLMPKWKPARIDGKAVKCYYNLPFSFKIN